MVERYRKVVAALCVLVAATLGTLALLRFTTVHQETFDLAFYARMAWGPIRGSFWEPIVGAHILGLHVSLVMLPFGLITLIPGAIAPTLLLLQAAAVSAAAWPFAAMGTRRFGPAGALMGALVWLLYPNIGHVATFEFHPGTVAVLPMAFALDALDRKAPRRFLIATLCVLACREDLGLCTALLGLVAAREPILRGVGLKVAAGSLAFVGLFVVVLLPLLGPPEGSVQLHFGKWGGSLFDALLGVITRPADVWAHLVAPERWSYLPRLLAPLAFVPLLGPRFLVPALPLLGINLLSEWPTTTALDSHYQTTLLPFLVAASLEGAERLASRTRPVYVGVALVTFAAVGHFFAGGTPLSRDFEAASFQDDARSAAARAVLAEVPAEASVQAPYALMPHLAERTLFGPPPPPDRDYDLVIFDAWHRARYAHDEDLLRTEEEPTLRNWLARDDYGLTRVEPPYLVLQRGEDPRAWAASTGILRSEVPSAPAVGLTDCLLLVGATRQGERLDLDLAAAGPCGADLAIRIGRGRRPARVDLLFDGLLSPAHLRPGDRLQSLHVLDADEQAAFDEGALRVGLLRSSGARPRHEDPVSVPLRPPRRVE